LRELPVFVPYEDDHLAAVITVPDGDPAALVLLLTGTGAPRSHRFQLWTRAARALADQGLASVRMDYRGVGDSTGRMPQLVLGDRRRDQAMAVARFAMAAVGIDRFGIASNCSGAVIGLEIAAEMPECTAAILILPRLVQLGGVTRAHMEARKSRLASLVRSNKSMRRILQGTMKGRKDMPSPAVRKSFYPALEHARLLFVYGDIDRDPYVEKSRRLLGQLADRLPPDRRARLEVVTTSEGPLAGFESISVQSYILDRVVSWLPAALGAAATREPALNPSGSSASERS
jgi:alpha/beta superfamily hydrolase